MREAGKWNAKVCWGRKEQGCVKPQSILCHILPIHPLVNLSSYLAFLVLLGADQFIPQELIVSWKLVGNNDLYYKVSVMGIYELGSMKILKKEILLLPRHRGASRKWCLNWDLRGERVCTTLQRENSMAVMEKHHGVEQQPIVHRVRAENVLKLLP